MENPLNILVFSPFYPPHIGGLESHAYEFNQHIAKHNIHISVFTPKLPLNTMEEEHQSENISIYRFPAFEIIHNYPVPKLWSPTLWKLLKKSITSQPNIVISRTRFFSTSIFAYFFAKIQKIPLIHIEHGSDYVHFNSQLKTLLGACYDRIFGRFILRHANTVIANSKASAAFVRKLSGRTAAIIYRGVEISAILSCETANHSPLPKSNACTIGFVGRLIDGKGVNLLLEAISNIKGRNFCCLIIGDGPERHRLESFAQKNLLSQCIRFLGHKDHSEAIAIIKSCDIIVNPSFTEGLPTSIIEAALCKKAIVATNVGGTSEIITGNDDGFLVPPGSVEAIQEKLEYLIDHPNVRTRFGNHAFLSTQSVFDWETSVKKYQKIFQMVLKK
ncbi:MAG: glycosyltransferase family 4 protein [Candidatus Moraniibacteriota bacterium]|nr:MAG: glycosyltransferase family 4 protein [Candidatus Moranbacteria bacterium]